MSLSGIEIYKQIKKGRISITPFNKENLGPNSYDLHLGPELYQYSSNNRTGGFLSGKNTIIDSKNPPSLISVPQITTANGKGWVLNPNTLYLGSTAERTYCKGFEPSIDGRSSFGRLGVFCHVTAGRGDDGFDGTWTLELAAVEPIIIYPGERYFQIFFDPIIGKSLPYSKSGRYQGQTKPTPSRIADSTFGRHGDKIPD